MSVEQDAALLGGVFKTIVGSAIGTNTISGILTAGQSISFVTQATNFDQVRSSLTPTTSEALNELYGKGNVRLTFTPRKNPARIIMLVEVAGTSSGAYLGSMTFEVTIDDITVDGNVTKRLVYVCTKVSIALTIAGQSVKAINDRIASASGATDPLQSIVNSVFNLDLGQLFKDLQDSNNVKLRLARQALGEEAPGDTLESNGIFTNYVSIDLQALLDFAESDSDTMSITINQVVTQSATNKTVSAPNNAVASSVSGKYFRSSPHGVCVQVNETQIIRILAQTDIFGWNMSDVVMGYYLVNVPTPALQLGECYPDSPVYQHHVKWTEGEGDVWTRYPLKFGLYVVGTQCNFFEKAQAFRIANYPALDDFEMLGRISLYGLLRYFLWFLITGHWDLNILRRTYTNAFYAILLASDYAIFYEAFSDPQSEIYGLDVAFIA